MKNLKASVLCHQMGFLLKCFPIVVLITYLWLAFVYIYEFCFFYLTLKVLIIFATVQNLLLIMVIFALATTVLTPMALVPEDFKLTDSEHQLFIFSDEEERDSMLKQLYTEKNLSIHTISKTGHIRYCVTCRHIKPDRAHHCSICGTCVLKMDHHCPWVHNCVGFTNYKQFILLLFYSTLFCTFFLCTVLPHILEGFHVHLLVGFVTTVCLAVFTFSLFCFHLGLICKNSTTVDTLQPVYFNSSYETYNLGFCKNMKQVFGDNILLWLVPVKTITGNGYTFEIRNLRNNVVD